MKSYKTILTVAFLISAVGFSLSQTSAEQTQKTADKSAQRLDQISDGFELNKKFRSYPIKKFTCKNATIRQALSKLAKQVGLSLNLNTDRLEPLYSLKEKYITLDLKNTTAHFVMQRIYQQIHAHEKLEEHLTYVIKPGQIIITTGDKEHDKILYTRIYDIRDIVKRLEENTKAFPEFPPFISWGIISYDSSCSEPLIFSEDSEGIFQEEEDESDIKNLSLKLFANLIRSMTDFEQWKYNGGVNHIIQLPPSSLAIHTDFKTHCKIEKLLHQFRKFYASRASYKVQTWMVEPDSKQLKAAGINVNDLMNCSDKFQKILPGLSCERFFVCTKTDELKTCKSSTLTYGLGEIEITHSHSRGNLLRPTFKPMNWGSIFSCLVSKKFGDSKTVSFKAQAAWVKKIRFKKGSLKSGKKDEIIITDLEVKGSVVRCDTDIKLGKLTLVGATYSKNGKPFFLFVKVTK